MIPFKGNLGWYWFDNRHPIGHVGPFLKESMAKQNWKVFNVSFPTLRQRRQLQNSSQSVKSV